MYRKKGWTIIDQNANNSCLRVEGLEWIFVLIFIPVYIFLVLFMDCVLLL